MWVVFFDARFSGAGLGCYLGARFIAVQVWVGIWMLLSAVPVWFAIRMLFFPGEDSSLGLSLSVWPFGLIPGTCT